MGLVYLVSFGVGKVLFLALDHAETSIHFTDYLQVLLHGLSLDLSVLGYLLILPTLLCLASYAWRSAPVVGLTRWWHILSALLLGLITVGDLLLYPFWGFKLDATIFQYLDSPQNAAASVSTLYILGAVLAVLLYSGLLFLALDWHQPRHWQRGRHWWVGAFVFLVLPGPLFLMIRGGVSQATANVGQVYFSTTQLLNHAAVNPTFSLLSSLSKTDKYEDEYNYYSPSELTEHLRGLYPTESGQRDSLLTTERPNILLIILESFGAKYIGALGGTSQTSTQLDRLAKEGILFTHCYANSFRTDRGVLSVLSGYPSFPRHSVMKIPAKSRTLPSIARSLDSAGYQTDFYYGGDANFTNMRGYLMATGFDRVIDEPMLPRSLHRGNWGVQDGDLLGYLAGQIRQRPAGKPWMTTLLTLSSHEPFDVPEQRLPAKVANAFAYTDAQLGKFIDGLRQSPQWKDLLIICVADHGSNADGSEDRNSSFIHHIPMLWLGGAVRSPRTIPQLLTQSDLAATLLAQLGLPYGSFRFSRDVLSSSYTYPFAYYTFNEGYGYIDASGISVIDLQSGQALEESPTGAGERHARGQALLQTTHDDLGAR